jgi:hypothetical protein
LRLLDKPLTNVEYVVIYARSRRATDARTTGVTAAVVERMEVQLKQDVLAEIRHGEGRVLLHDEVETKPGCYEIIPIWETVEEDEVMTPRELYESVIKEKYHVDYKRVAIVSQNPFMPTGNCTDHQTDEQAPLPASLQVIVDRVAEGLDHKRDFV